MVICPAVNVIPIVKLKYPILTEKLGTSKMPKTLFHLIIIKAVFLNIGACNIIFLRNHKTLLKLISIQVIPSWREQAVLL